jgi:hypothetical protein
MASIVPQKWSESDARQEGADYEIYADSKSFDGRLSTVRTRVANIARAIYNPRQSRNPRRSFARLNATG